MKRFKLGIIATHPIQYHAPWYRAMAADARFDLHVFYCHRATAEDQAEAGFGVKFEWDRPLLDGYPHSFLENVARHPSVSTFAGIDTPAVRDVIRDHQFDSVLVNGWNHKSTWQAILACWRDGTPVMVRGDSHLRTQRGAVKRAVKALPYRIFVPRLNACIAVGTWSKEYYLHYGASPERVFIVPHVVDEEWLLTQCGQLEPRRDELRRKWGLAEGRTVFLFAGKLIPKKRPRDFVLAIGRAAAAGAPVQGLVAGDGPLRDECEALAASEKSPVTFAGFLNQSELASVYVSADVLVLPSDGETWGLVVNEAMCCGKPCIVSDQVGCGPDLVIQGETGAVFPVGDVEKLAAHIRFMAEDRHARQQTGARARERIKSCSIRIAVDATAAAVAAVTGRA